MANFQFLLIDNSSAPFVAEVGGVFWSCKAQIMDINSAIKAAKEKAAETPDDEAAQAVGAAVVASLETLKSISVRRQHWALHQLCDHFAGKNAKGEAVKQLDEAGKKAAIAFMRPLRNQLPDVLLGHCFSAGIFGAKNGADDASVSEAA